MRVSLPDGSTRDVPAGSTFLDLAKSIGPGLAKAAVVARLDDELVDLQAPIAREGKVTFLKADDPAAEDVIRHSCEHVLATAVLRLFPGAQVTMGPQDHSKDFYYDFDVGRAFTPDDLAKIEAEMQKVIDEDVPFVRKLVPKTEALAMFAKHGQRFKPEILSWIKDEQVTLYEDADFLDLCRGPHVPSAGRIGAFKLLGAAGSYWRGDATRDHLQRIRGVAFTDKKKLAKHFEQLELAKARDHRKLGKELELFGFSQLAPASPFFLPKGTIVYNKLVEYVRTLYRRYGYQEVVTPQIYSTEVWKISGHYENYADNMYFAHAGRPDAPKAPASSSQSLPLSEEHPHGVEIAVKPMNCPGHCVMYGMQLKSFRELPWRVADFGRLHRAEGEAVHGMMRVRTFSQDDAHIFCAEDQMSSEMEAFLALVDEVYGAFELSAPRIRLATRPEKRLGSLERFYGVYLEHTGGAFPPWLAPVQVQCVPVTDRALAHAEKLAAALFEAGHRADVDRRNEKLGAKIREAQLQKIPFVLVVGDKEVEQNAASVRLRGGKDLGLMPVDQVLKLIADETRMPAKRA